MYIVLLFNSLNLIAVERIHIILKNKFE